MNQKHIAVVNGLWVGHHPIYVKAFVKILIESGYRVSLFCPAPEDVTKWVEQTFWEDRSNFKAYYFTDRVHSWFWRHLPGRIRYTLQSILFWFNAARALRLRINYLDKPDLVFFAWVDCYLTGYLPVRFIDWLFTYTWSGLYFHPRHLRAENKSRIGRAIVSPEEFIAQSKRAASIAMLDEGVHGLIHAQLDGKPAFVLPDFSDEIPPIDQYHLAEVITEKAKGKMVIGLLGGISRRKGLLTFIRIAKQSTDKDWYFVFAGILLEHTFSKEELKEVKEFFDEPREDCFFYIKRIPDDAQFNALVNVCDVIFAMYEDFPHSSNLLTKSAIYGKSALVSAGGYMEEVVKQYNLGVVAPAGDVQAALTALQQLTSYEHSSKNISGMKEYAEKQTQENLKQIFLNLIEKSISH